MEKYLIKLGFSKEEAKIYLVLLEFGQSTAGPIVKKTALHRQVVYDTLEKLKRKELVLETIKSNRKNWLAADPLQIMKRVKIQESLVKEILPDLFSLQKASKHRQEVKIFEGVEGFKAIHNNNLNGQPKDTIVPVFGAIGWVEMMKKAKYFKKYEKERLDKNIVHHLILLEKERKNI